MKKNHTLAVFSLLSLMTIIGAGFLAPAFAHKGAKGVVKQRMQIMKNMKDHLKNIADMVEGKAAFNDQQILENLDYISAHGAGKMTKIFPRGTAHKPSEADPSIWKNWSDFEKLARQLTVASGEFRTSLDVLRGDKPSLELEPLKKPYLSLRRSCKNCHDRFRK